MSELEITIDSSSSDEEVEETIRVLWTKTMKMLHVSIRLREPLEKLFNEISTIYSIPQDLLQVTYNEEPLSPKDCLESLGFRVARDSLYASRLESPTKPISSSITEPGRNRLRIKCIAKDRKKPFEYYLLPKQRLQDLLEQLSEDLNTPVPNIKLKFDGDNLAATDTPEKLDLEGDECLDVFVI